MLVGKYRFSGRDREVWDKQAEAELWEERLNIEMDAWMTKEPAFESRACYQNCGKG